MKKLQKVLAGMIVILLVTQIIIVQFTGRDQLILNRIFILGAFAVTLASAVLLLIKSAITVSAGAKYDTELLRRAVRWFAWFVIPVILVVFSVDYLQNVGNNPPCCLTLTCILSPNSIGCNSCATEGDKPGNTCNMCEKAFSQYSKSSTYDSVFEDPEFVREYGDICMDRE